MKILTIFSVLSLLGTAKGSLTNSAINSMDHLIMCPFLTLFLEPGFRRVLFIGDKNSDLPNGFFRGLPLVIADETGLDEDNSILKFIDKHQAFIIAPKSVETLNETLDQLVASESFQHGRFIVIAKGGDSLQAIADILWKKNKQPNCIIIHNNVEVHLLKILDCGNGVGVTEQICSLPNCSIPRFNFKNVFLGCPIKVLWMRYPPFVYSLQDPSGFRGIFIDFLDSLSYQSKRPLSLKADDLEYLEDLSTMINYESVIADLEEADIFLGSSDLRTSPLFHLSPIMNEDEVVFFAPRMPMNYWKHFSGVMNKIELGILLIIFLVGIVMLLLGNFGGGKIRSRARWLQDIMLYLYGMLLGNGRNTNWFTSSGLRLYLSHILLLFLVVSLFLQGSLVSVLSGPLFERKITTTDELVELGLPFKTTSVLKSAIEFYSQYINDPNLKTLQNELEVLDQPMILSILDDLIVSKSYATLMLKAFTFMRPNVEKRFDFFPLLRLQNCLAMGKNSYQGPYFFKWISRGLAAGFLERFKNFHRFQLALRWNVEVEEKFFVLTMDQVGPAFKSLAVGYFAALCLLMGEMLWYYGAKYWRSRRMNLLYLELYKM